MIYSGEICEIDAARGYVKVRIPALDNIVTEWIAFGRQFTVGASQSFPIAINTQVLVCETVESRWFVLCATPNDEDQPYNGAGEKKWGAMFPDGTLIEYDYENGYMQINAPEAVIAIVAKQINVTALKIELSGQVDIDGILTVNGEITSATGISSAGDMAVAGNLSVQDGEISISNGDVVTDGISLKSHIHTGVQTGSGVSGVPLGLP